MAGEEKGRVGQVVVAALRSDFWRTAILVALGVAGLYWFLSWRAQVRDVELALLRQENVARRAEMAKVVAGAEAQNKALAETNAGLRRANDQLGAKVGALTAEMRRLTDLANRRVEAIAVLPLESVGRDIATLIDVPKTEITQTETGIALTDRAARADLRQLVLGQTARQQIELAVREASALRAQNANLGQENSNLGQMVENERGRSEAITKSVILDLEEARKETQVVKARARKRHMIYGFVGLVAGVAVAAL